jgi:hypothetical protein
MADNNFSYTAVGFGFFNALTGGFLGGIGLCLAYMLMHKLDLISL